MVAVAEVRGCRSWHPLAGVGGQVEARLGHRAGTQCWWQGPGGGQHPHLRSPMAHPTASSQQAVLGAGEVVLALMAQGSGCSGCEGWERPPGSALSLRR